METIIVESRQENSKIHSDCWTILLFLFFKGWYTKYKFIIRAYKNFIG
jgi:hypothetical protein